MTQLYSSGQLQGKALWINLELLITTKLLQLKFLGTLMEDLWKPFIQMESPQLAWVIGFWKHVCQFRDRGSCRRRKYLEKNCVKLVIHHEDGLQS